MHGLILTGGEGSRLAAAGVREPKALVRVAGRPQLFHLIETLADLGCGTVTCMLRAGVPATWEESAGQGRGTRVSVVPCRTPSSLHTLRAGLDLVPPGAVFCTMVDTVMPQDAWARVYAGISVLLEARVPAVVVAAPAPAADDAPLLVVLDATGSVLRIGGAAAGSRWATAGVYGFGPGARALAAEAVARGCHGVRAFLGLLLDLGYPVRAVAVPRAVDVDRRRDLAAARAWLAAEDDHSGSPTRRSKSMNRGSARRRSKFPWRR
jgi:NDP-sugar pyrophosphorylase family protein